MNTTGETGICPNCEGRGRALEECTESVCRQRGYRYVPTSYVTTKRSGIPDPLVGLMLGNYLVARPLGAGAFGMVYLGLQQPIQLEAAVKVLNLDEVGRDMRSVVLSNVETEARALAVVRHPNVVGLLEYGTWREHPFLVTEYVQGGRTLQADIETRAGRAEHFGLDDLRGLFDQILDGLEAAHSAGIIHRDIKPANVMLQDVPGHPRLVRILDFGLAKFLQAGDSTRITSGTPEYMAPEQLTGERLGPWTDLYATGILAFELLTGHIPFLADNVDRSLFLKLNPRYDPLSILSGDDLTPEARAFLARALTIEPSDRYRSTHAMKVGLHEALASLSCRPGDPLSGVSLHRLVEGAEFSNDPTTLAAPLMTVEPSAGPADGDEAFRRWMDREKGRLMTAERDLDDGPSRR